MILHCGFNLHSLMITDVEHLFICLLAVCMSSLLAAKSFSVLIWSDACERAPWWLKDDYWFQGEFQAEAKYQAVAEGPRKASGLPKLLVLLESEPSTEILSQPSLSSSQPEKASQVLPIFLRSFTSSRKWFSGKSQR